MAKYDLEERLLKNPTLSTRKEFIEVAIKNKGLSIKELSEKSSDLNTDINEKYEEMKYIIDEALQKFGVKYDEAKIEEFADMYTILSKFGSVLTQMGNIIQNKTLEKLACKNLIKTKLNKGIIDKSTDRSTQIITNKDVTLQINTEKEGK